MFVFMSVLTEGMAPVGKDYHQRAERYCTTTNLSLGLQLCPPYPPYPPYPSYPSSYLDHLLNKKHFPCSVCAAAGYIDLIQLQINSISWSAIVSDVFQVTHTHALPFSSLPALTQSQPGSLDLPSPPQISFRYYHTPLNLHERLRRPGVKGPAVSSVSNLQILIMSVGVSGHNAGTHMFRRININRVISPLDKCLFIYSVLFLNYLL